MVNIKINILRCTVSKIYKKTKVNWMVAKKTKVGLNSVTVTTVIIIIIIIIIIIKTLQFRETEM